MLTQVATPEGETGTTTVLSRSWYDGLKYLVTIILPAFSALYLVLASTWEWPEPEKVVGTVAAITTFLGICLGISSARYNRAEVEHDGDLVLTEDPGGVATYQLQLNADPEQLKDKDVITFKVQKQAA